MAVISQSSSLELQHGGVWRHHSNVQVSGANLNIYESAAVTLSQFSSFTVIAGDINIYGNSEFTYAVIINVSLRW